MEIGDQGKILFREWEGVIPRVYLDSGGAPTIGIGHLLTPSERSSGKLWLRGQPLAYRDGISAADCEALLEQDLEPVQRCVNGAVTVPLTQNQFDALVSFAFNVGNEAFLNSTLLKRLNAGLLDEVPAQLARWNRDHDRVVPGLVNRRNKEIALWLQA
jgi:lysozyme